MSRHFGAQETDCPVRICVSVDRGSENPMKGLRSKARREMVQASGHLFQLLGLPRSTGQNYGLFYLSATPQSLDDIVGNLGISKGSASTGTRCLLAWGALKQVRTQGQRRDYFEAVGELRVVLSNAYRDYVKTRIATYARRLATMVSLLEEDSKTGALDKSEAKFCAQRLGQLDKMHQTLRGLAPWAEKFLN